jgi:hypothetical protein
MITFYITWLQRSFAIDKDRLILRVSINQLHKSRLRDVEKYWSEITKIPKSQFTKTSLIKAASKKTEYDTKHYGTLRIKVRRGTMLRHKILGAIAAIN